MPLDLLLTAAALSLTAWLTWRGTDAWPFTRYPMFSRRLDIRDVKVIRFALETADGKTVWWKPRFERDLDRIGDRIAGYGPAQILWAASEVFRLIEFEEGDSFRYRAIEIIERRWVDGAPSDRQIARIPVGKQVFAS